MEIIALSGTIGVGKSTVADILVTDYGFVRVKFADALKNMLRSLGLTEREIEGDLKEKPCDRLCGHTPRHAMITLGTEWGRDRIHPELWVTITKRKLLFMTATKVVLDDCRFPNEAKMVHDLGGQVWKVSRQTGRASVPYHISEQGQKDVQYDVVLNNEGTLEELKRKVRMYLSVTGVEL